MRKSLLKKNLFLCTVSLLLCLTVLCIILVNYTISMWETKIDTTLADCSSQISATLGKHKANLDKKLSEGEKAQLTDALTVFSEIADADVYICNSKGIIISAVSKSGAEYDGKTILPETLEKANDKALIKGTLSGIYDEDYYAAVAPITIDEKTVGYSFSADKISDNITRVFPIITAFIISTLAIALISVFFLYRYSVNLLKPLKEMSSAAKAFALGDFSSRVKVKSNDEMGNLATAFNNMADSLSNSETLRRSFIANVSHELKTPMTTISGFIDGILDGTIPKEEQNSYLNTVSNEIKRLSRLVTSMLSLSRIDSGELKLKKSTFNLTNIVIQTLFSFEQIIESKCIDVRGLDLLDSVVVEADYDLLYQVIYNLFENATKFTQKGGYIEVRISDTPEKTSVSIINSGHGVEKEELPMIFDKFYKTDKSRNKDKKGMGLGLYIVRTIMHLHGGDITADSEIDKFTDFTFWWPKSNNLQ